MEINIAQIFIILLFGFFSFRIGFNTGKQEGYDYIEYVLETLKKHGVDLSLIEKKVSDESEV